MKAKQNKRKIYIEKRKGRKKDFTDVQSVRYIPEMVLGESEIVMRTRDEVEGLHNCRDNCNCRDRF